ncbi:MAG: hypothetical protein A2W23_09015 [Planctomycetes bacterium RBG_16_43_13]|nr:MAG: hypothetical protein A2W23_09015 [Planctomycetes bacterium RBG_16_43_13]
MHPLIDENISFRIAELLRQDGYDAIHIRDTHLKGRSDVKVSNTLKGTRSLWLHWIGTSLISYIFHLGTMQGLYGLGLPIRLRIKSIGYCSLSCRD